MPEIPSTQILDSLKGLSIPERIQIVEDLWDNIAIPQENFGLPEAQARELEKRIDALEKNESPLSSWDEVRQRITNGR
jgi:putative addiction module component (TIGR02574 family)